MKINIDQIMQLIQEFASTYSLAGTQFDDGHKYAEAMQAKQEIKNLLVAADQSSPAKLYAALRNMHWNEGKLAVIDARNLKLGVQTYSGEMLDTAIEQAIKAADHSSINLPTND